MGEFERYLIPTELAPQVLAVFVAALLEIGVDIGDPDGWQNGQPWWWGAPNDATYRASTIARVSAGLEPLPDFKTFVAYQRYTRLDRLQPRPRATSCSSGTVHD